MSKKDLVVLAADKDIEHTLMGLLSRPEALGIREISCDIRVDPGHDPACARNGVSFLSSFSKQYDYALLLFDHKGSGKEDMEPEKLQQLLNQNFERSGWGERAKAIIIAPELETWVWTSSPHVDHILGWENQQPSLRDWMEEKKLWLQGEPKPHHPKEAFRNALRKSRIPRSASLFQKLAEQVSLKNCEDRAFQELLSTLQAWFPPNRVSENTDYSGKGGVAEDRA